MTSTLTTCFEKSIKKLGFIPMSKSNRILLPDGISPKHYTLSLVPNLNNFSFLGTVLINLKVSKNSEKIVLHSSNLSLRTIVIVQAQLRRSIDVKEVIVDKEEETIEIPANVSEGEADLKIEFSGEINDKMAGFYRSTFKDSEGKSHMVGCTQFEPTDARKAFPCWDEPAHKATFDVIITAPKNFIVLSNSHIKEETDIGENGTDKKVVFFTSPKMSTYLLAWFIGEYKGMTVTTKNGIMVSIYTPPEQLKKANWALSVANSTLSYFEDYFQIKYPLRKLDMLAISDFVNGAMENWGLITYRDSAIYCDENSSTKAKEWVTSVVAHELAHQWFGNLVTMQWWSELWLNEGFATFMQVLANDKIYPDWGLWETFVDENLETALELDSLMNSHPVEVEILHSKEINEVFDIISYKKGASLLRMLYEYIGNDDFQKGVSNYLQDYAYSNSDSFGLWKHLSESSNKDVEGFMHTFTLKQGFPFIEVKLIAKEGNTFTFKLKQSRFLSSGEKEIEGTLWKIPIRVDISGEQQWIYMENKTLEVKLEAKKAKYVLFNSGATGFFRTLHSKEMIEDLMKAVVESTLPVSDRYMILSDAKAFLVAGKLSADQLLTLLENYKGESKHIVWTSIISSIDKLKRIVLKTNVESSFNKFANALMSQIHKKLGENFPKEEDMGVTKLRGDIIHMMANCEDEKMVSFLNTKFEDFVNKNEEMNPNIFSAALRTAIKHGGESQFKKVQEIAETSTDPMKKNQALSALGASKNLAILKKALDYILTDKVKKQDTFFVFSSVAHNKDGIVLAWEFFKENYQLLRETYVHDSLFSKFVSVVSRMNNAQLVKDAENFFENKDTKGYEKKLSQSFEAAKLDISLKEREFSTVEKWLKENGY